MVVINDISERTKLRESKMSEMLKTIMLCSISHELRSPVNQINGVLTLLYPTLTSERQLGLFNIANSSVELLKLKVNDMLDFYEVETNNFQPKMAVFNPRKMLTYIKKVFLPILDKNNLKLYFMIHENAPEYIYHDADRIQKVLINFVSNAVKYTRKGIICISFDWELDLENPPEGTIKFSVSDTGIGIAKERRENLLVFLDPSNYKNAEDGIAATPKLAGTGLGISQKIMNMLGSQIELISAEGSGTIFWFKLKINKENLSKIPANQSVRCIMDPDENIQKSLRTHIDSDRKFTFDFEETKKLKRSASLTGALKLNYNLFEINSLDYSDSDSCISPNNPLAKMVNLKEREMIRLLDNTKRHNKDEDHTKLNNYNDPINCNQRDLDKYSPIEILPIYKGTTQEENMEFRWKVNFESFDKDLVVGNEISSRIRNIPLFVEDASSLGSKADPTKERRQCNSFEVKPKYFDVGEKEINDISMEMRPLEASNSFEETKVGSSALTLLSHPNNFAQRNNLLTDTSLIDKENKSKSKFSKNKSEINKTMLAIINKDIDIESLVICKLLLYLF